MGNSLVSCFLTHSVYKELINNMLLRLSVYNYVLVYGYLF